MNKIIFFMCLIAAVAVLLWLYQINKLGAVLPWILIAACPILHIVTMKYMHDTSSSSKNKKCH